MLAVERQLGVKRKFGDAKEILQAAEKKAVKLEAKRERSSRESQRSDLERGFAALSSTRRAREPTTPPHIQGDPSPVEVTDVGETDVEGPEQEDVLLPDGTIDRTPPSSQDSSDPAKQQQTDDPAAQSREPRGRKRRLSPTAKFRSARPPSRPPPAHLKKYAHQPQARKRADAKRSGDSRPPLKNPESILSKPTNALAIVKQKMKQMRSHPKFQSLRTAAAHQAITKKYEIDVARLQSHAGEKSRLAVSKSGGKAAMPKFNYREGFVRGPRPPPAAASSSSSSRPAAPPPKAAARADLPSRYSDVPSGGG